MGSFRRLLGFGVFGLAATLVPLQVFADDLTGVWTLSIDTPRGLQHPTLEISEGEAGYSGVYNSRRGPIEIEKINRDGTKFSFPLVISVPIGDIEVNYIGKFEGNEMEGTVQNPRGEVPFTGVRND
jgi:hypothetical protein